jgi:hypothetical protein
LSKVFVLDTNVLLFDPQSIFAFGDNTVFIPLVVIEELDRFKKDQNENGRNARQFSRMVDELRQQGSLSEGVKLDNGGKLVIAFDKIHNISVTTPALGFLLESEIDTVFLTLRGRYKGRLVGPSGGNGRLRLHQYRRTQDPAWALETARAIVIAKLHNTRTFLRRYARRRTAQSAAPLTQAADDLTALIERAGRCRTVNSLNGVEGRGAAVYFSVFRHLIKGHDWHFTRRQRRPLPTPSTPSSPSATPSSPTTSNPPSAPSDSTPTSAACTKSPTTAPASPSTWSKNSAPSSWTPSSSAA